MVFPGRKSSGCGLCRKRKVKCDERRPGCRRCELYYTECPGYERPLVFRFHEERSRTPAPGHVVPARSPPRRKSRSSFSGAAGEVHETAPALPSKNEGDADGVLHSESTLRIAWQPQPSWEDESITYFLHEHCIAPKPGVSSGHLDFLFDLYSSCFATSCLKPATLAAAYLSLSRHHKSTKLYLEARKYYGLALCSVKSSLSDLQEGRQDEILSAIMLLSFFEDIDGQVPGVKAFHILGISGVFEARGCRLLGDIQHGSLYRWIFIQLAIHSFVTQESKNCLSVPEPTPNPSHPADGAIITVARITQFCSLVANHLATMTENRVTSTEDHDSVLWLMHQAMYIQVEALLKHDSSKITAEMDLINATAASAEQNLVLLIGNICGSLPYLFGEVDEQGTRRTSPRHKAVVLYNIVWPLALVSKCVFSTKYQSELCKSCLGRIASMYGLNLALAAENALSRALLGQLVE